MPTATAVEVSEKIADSSDDAVSVLSSTAPTAKKPVTTAITPTVNSSASTETVEQKSSKLTEATSDDAVKKAASGKEGASESESKATNAEQKQDGSAAPTGPSGQLAEPTADDVMAGLDDDIMEQNGSEAGDEKQQREKDFNDDLTFQMDVDEEPAGETGGPKAGGKNENDSAMDLTAAGEPAKEKRTTTTTTDGSASSEPEVRLDERRASTTTSQTSASGKESAVDMHDKTVVTSTPVTDPKKAQQKRLERGQEAAALEVKQEQEEEADEAQNLSKQRASAAGPPARAGERANAPRNKAVEQQQEVGHPSGSRKRRRSVEPEEERRPGEAADCAAESEEPLEPAKKLKLEVDANYQTHERVVNEYIETTANTSVDEIQSHTDALVKEIQTLNDMIRDTEMKWNNLLHLKKVKEEILLRLNRRKHVIGIMDTRLGEVSVYSHLDSSNLSSHHQPGGGGRSSSVGPRPPTPPPEVEIRPASVANSMHYGFGGGNNGTTNGADKSNSSSHHHFGNSLISNRRSSSSSVQTGSKRASGKDSTSSFVSQFNSSNNAVTMVPLPQTATMILNARANMNPVEVAKEKSAAVQIQRQILPKPVLSNHQQILNNLAISAGLTGSSNSANSGGSATALLNGHHNPSGSNSANHLQQQQQLQIGRQGMRKDVSSIIADYRQKHPENVPRRGRRLKNVGGGSGSGNNGTSAGNSLGSFGEGGAISLTALSGAKSPANARPNSTDSVANRISELLAAAEVCIAVCVCVFVRISFIAHMGVKSCSSGVLNQIILKTKINIPTHLWQTVVYVTSTSF
uniref:Uncharacterized protein n=1 Tax=Anopheles coluzzii TaxID=1518534 RepID=A0A8W7Q0A8_ANOCL